MAVAGYHFPSRINVQRNFVCAKASTTKANTVQRQFFLVAHLDMDAHPLIRFNCVDSGSKLFSFSAGFPHEWLAAYLGVSTLLLLMLSLFQEASFESFQGILCLSESHYLLT